MRYEGIKRTLKRTEGENRRGWMEAVKGSRAERGGKLETSLYRPHSSS